MRRIDKPNFGIRDVFNKHQKHFMNRINKKHAEIGQQGTLDWLNSIEDYLCDREAEYQSLGERTLLANIKECKENNYFNANEIEESYKYIYSSGQHFRSQIANIANGICPICDSILGYGMLELDHILPKSTFCDYAITPINLVPVCTACNKAKHSRVGNENEGILTPYYNNYPLNRVIQIEITVENDDVRAKTSLINEDDFCDLLRCKNLDSEQIANLHAKIKHHFSLHKIDTRLEEKANVVLYSTILETVRIPDKTIIKHKELENYLLSLKNNYDQEYVNEEYIKNRLIDAITQHKDTNTVYGIIQNKISDMRERRKSSLELSKSFNV